MVYKTAFDGVEEHVDERRQCMFSVSHVFDK